MIPKDHGGVSNENSESRKVRNAASMKDCWHFAQTTQAWSNTPQILDKGLCQKLLEDVTRTFGTGLGDCWNWWLVVRMMMVTIV